MSALAPIPAAIRPGLKATLEKIVPFEWTIAYYNPSLPPVFSTPAMIGMMEVTAARAIMPHLPPGAISVGTRIAVDHLRAVPAGAKIKTTALLEKIDGWFLRFAVEARSGRQVVGRGHVYRALVRSDQFRRAAGKRKKRSPARKSRKRSR